MKRHHTILVADDEKKIADVLSLYLEQAGFGVVCVDNGSEVLRRLEGLHPSLIILDLMLPDIPGEEVCMAVRARSAVPILMLTAKHRDEDRLRGLQIGADDYVTKPFNPNEVVARVQAILRRTMLDHPLADRLEYRDGDLVIDALSQVVYKGGINAELTATEYKLLVILSRHPRRVFSREELIERVFGMDFRGDVRTIDAHVKNLRAKIEDDPKSPVYIQTVYGMGYRFGGDGN
ncbi:response regulator transcription factor [Alicyclobacillus acidocaldarius]|uniref:Two component transcriptional regulator, winged helix family n=1 Tax=Alicyclobacillus acidocaldarius subsp. acidocaldarius (strain ATCC 27009 / DSM 446 / BCRC 14685 / JCM 5260 / KCTC 1825 / NBRC 15652 / NCIMB 11725 / NRRL B-14509 / 104-IA) TaxID=521098 RepID=C8WVL8_ALIAD|nr:response regulator transcription factor [Alicyclobacillus acidocaldarius]ACV58140.1 two component transcriptional regulator, winged helix family [Alicyclobacillus acidocaldarius subsp. acidocaldarius DSM 446]MCL6444481.1 response regulator transcription factor [Alicyclobacillus sp.]